MSQGRGGNNRISGQRRGVKRHLYRGSRGQFSKEGRRSLRHPHLLLTRGKSKNRRNTGRRRGGPRSAQRRIMNALRLQVMRRLRLKCSNDNVRSQRGRLLPNEKSSIYNVTYLRDHRVKIYNIKSGLRTHLTNVGLIQRALTRGGHRIGLPSSREDLRVNKEVRTTSSNRMFTYVRTISSATNGCIVQQIRRHRARILRLNNSNGARGSCLRSKRTRRGRRHTPITRSVRRLFSSRECRLFRYLCLCLNSSGTSFASFRSTIHAT